MQASRPTSATRARFIRLVSERGRRVIDAARECRVAERTAKSWLTRYAPVHVRQSRERMADRRRRIVMLAKDGLTKDQIAEAVGISPRAVFKALRRARERGEYGCPRFIPKSPVMCAG